VPIAADRGLLRPHEVKELGRFEDAGIHLPIVVLSASKPPETKLLSVPHAGARGDLDIFGFLEAGTKEIRFHHDQAASAVTPRAPQR